MGDFDLNNGGCTCYTKFFLHIASPFSMRFVIRITYTFLCVSCEHISILACYFYSGLEFPIIWIRILH